MHIWMVHCDVVRLQVMVTEEMKWNKIFMKYSSLNATLCQSFNFMTLVFSVHCSRSSINALLVLPLAFVHSNFPSNSSKAFEPLESLKCVRCMPVSASKCCLWNARSTISFSLTRFHLLLFKCVNSCTQCFATSPAFASVFQQWQHKTV